MRDFFRKYLEDQSTSIKTNVLMTSTPGIPSLEDRCVWMYAHGATRDYKEPHPKSGKWLLFHKPEKIDEAWAKVWDLTVNGKLGFSAKVSTGYSRKGPEHVICVYTKDYNDMPDVKRVRQGLRDIGYLLPISYKSDEMTRIGKEGSLYYF